MPNPTNPPEQVAAPSLPQVPEPAISPAPGLAPKVTLTGPTEKSRAVDYFIALAFGKEYGSSDSGLHKWDRDIRIKVYGQPTPADRSALQLVLAELDKLTPGITLNSVSDNPNIEIHFVPESQFSALEPKYIPTNYGFFRVWWDRTGDIYRARILISSDGISQKARTHLIREELTQSLGLFNDSWEHPTSIFYQGWTTTADYSSLDRRLIGWLYRPTLTAGMTPVQAAAALGEFTDIVPD
ncbi:MAG: DUF2927 domain-containing protein [Dehalococcoidia bacterium]